MDDMQPVEFEPPTFWRVRKLPDNSIYGPVDEATLREWANAAQISPEDLIDYSDEEWRPAPEVDFLGMIWIVKLPGDEIYGPTTVGTLREFIQEGLISDKTIASNVLTNQALPVGALFAALEFEKKREIRRAPQAQAMDGRKSTFNLTVDLAKEQRIRQLEEDLRALQKEHNNLTQRYRQLTLEMETKAAPVAVAVATPKFKFGKR